MLHGHGALEYCLVRRKPRHRCTSLFAYTCTKVFAFVRRQSACPMAAVTDHRRQYHTTQLALAFAIMRSWQTLFRNSLNRIK